MNFRNLATAAGKLARSSDLSRRKNLLNLYPSSSSLYSSATTVKRVYKKFRAQAQPQPPASPPKSDDCHPPPSPRKSIDFQLQPSPRKSEDWPRPAEIPWQSKVANSINLIGHLEQDVQFKVSPEDGKFYAGTVICHNFNRAADSSPFFWIPIIFEGDLARIAACHLKKDDFVHISGQLSVDPPRIPLAEGQATVQVLVDSVSYVQGVSPSKKTTVVLKQELPVKQEVPVIQEELSVKQELPVIQEELSVKQELPVNPPANIKKDVEDSWRELLKNSKDWSDNRERKRNGSVKPNYPDFKNKQTGAALWLNRAPQFVLPGLEGLEFAAQPITTKQSVNDKRDQLDEDPWKNLVENPNNWWDNRVNKLYPKAPDFKHKKDGLGLWLSNAPEWVSSKLPPS